MKVLLNQPPNDEESVRHLVELGYVDPDTVAAREAALRSQLEAELQQATKIYAKGDLAEAARLLETLAIDDPNWVAPHQLLAEIYYRTGCLDTSQDHLDWLIEHGVEHPRLALIAGAIAIARREFNASFEWLAYAGHVDPTLPSVHTLLGTVLLRLGRLDSAEISFQEAIRQNAADAIAYDGIAAIQIRRGKFEDAANFALESLGHNMQLFGAHYHLGIALTNLKRPNEAITALETAAKVNTSRAAPYYWLSRIVAEQLGDSIRASCYRNAGREVVRRRRNRSAQNIDEANADL